MDLGVDLFLFVFDLMLLFLLDLDFLLEFPVFDLTLSSIIFLANLRGVSLFLNEISLLFKLAMFFLRSVQVSDLGILVGLVLEVLSLVTAQILLSFHESTFQLLESLTFSTNVGFSVVHLVGGVFPVDLTCL